MVNTLAAGIFLAPKQVEADLPTLSRLFDLLVFQKHFAVYIGLKVVCEQLELLCVREG